MKRFILFAVCLSLTHFALNAQSVKYGLKLGISTPDIKPKDAKDIMTDSLLLKVKDANYGFHAGGWLRVKLGNFIIQPELVFNSSKTTYSATALKGSAIVDSIKTESFKNLDMPILIGFKLGGLRFNGGPVGHLHISSSSELTDLKSYDSKFQSMTWGYQAGLGADFGPIAVDIRYEGNFNKYGDHISIGNKSYNFSKSPSRMLVSLAYAF